MYDLQRVVVILLALCTNTLQADKLIIKVNQLSVTNELNGKHYVQTLYHERQNTVLVTSKLNLPMGLNVHSNLLRLSKDGRKWGEVGGWVPMSYHLLVTLSRPD